MNRRSLLRLALPAVVALAGLGACRRGEEPLQSVSRRIAAEPTRFFFNETGSSAVGAEAREKPWKITLGHEVRDAFVAPPGNRLIYPVNLGPESTLRFAYGLDGSRGSVDFLVWGQTDSAEQVTPLLARHLRAPSAAWHEAEIDLGSLGPGKVELIFETVTRGPVAQGVSVYWSDPRIVAPVASPRRPDIVLIVIDTLRADRVSLNGYSKATTPELDTWAQRRAVNFPHAVTASPWTLPSHVSIFTGLDSPTHGVNHSDPMPSSVRTLAEILRQNGYETRAITGGGYVHPQFGFAQGFHRYRYWPSVISSDGELEDGIERAREFLKGTPERPFFFFFHTYEVHSPFRARQPYFSRLSGKRKDDLSRQLAIRRRPLREEQGFATHGFYRRGNEPLTSEDRATLNALYDSGVAHTDALLSRLLTRLDERTLVVVTSDHGEALGEGGRASHAYLYDHDLLVPLLIAPPGSERAATTVEDQVRTIDILPTILDYAGIADGEAVAGHSLRPLIEGRVVEWPREAWSYAASSNHGISLRVANRLKYIFNNSAWPAIHARERLFRLRDDPAEEDNLAVVASETALLRERLRRRLLGKQRGVSLEFENGTQSAFLIELNQADWIDPERLKTFDLGAARIFWSPEKRLTVELAPRSRLSLLVERVDDSGNLEFLAHDSHDPCAIGLAVSECRAPRVLAFSSDGCPEPADDSSAAMVHLTVRLADVAAAGGEPLADKGLQRQLRALGYLN